MICVFHKTYCFQLEWYRIELKMLLQKMKMKKYSKNILSMVMYMHKNIIIKKYIYGI